MPPKQNPLKLNPLQLRTLTLLQELARDPRTSTQSGEAGEALITMIPQPHGDHIHVGRRVALTRDASGLWNEAVWNALQRKGLAVGSFPVLIRLTASGLGYETGLRDRILHGTDH
jgi:hypothetical protein